MGLLSWWQKRRKPPTPHESPAGASGRETGRRPPPMEADPFPRGAVGPTQDAVDAFMARTFGGSPPSRLSGDPMHRATQDVLDRLRGEG